MLTILGSLYFTFIESSFVFMYFWNYLLFEYKFLFMTTLPTLGLDYPNHTGIFFSFFFSLTRWYVLASFFRRKTLGPSPGNGVGLVRPWDYSLQVGGLDTPFLLQISVKFSGSVIIKS